MSSLSQINRSCIKLQTVWSRHRVMLLQLRQLLEQTGFEVVAMEAMLHCPRILAVKLAEVVSLAPLNIQQHFLQALMAFERLATLPTCYLTGHFIAVNAIKR